MSDKKLTYALIAISDIVGKVPGIDSSPEYISDKIPPGVWAMSYLAGGDFQHDPQGVLKGLHNIGLYVCCARVNLTSAAAHVKHALPASQRSPPPLWLGTDGRSGEVHVLR